MANSTGDLKILVNDNPTPHFRLQTPDRIPDVEFDTITRVTEFFSAPSKPNMQTKYAFSPNFSRNVSVTRLGISIEGFRRLQEKFKHLQWETKHLQETFFNQERIHQEKPVSDFEENRWEKYIVEKKNEIESIVYTYKFTVKTDVQLTDDFSGITYNLKKYRRSNFAPKSSPYTTFDVKRTKAKCKACILQFDETKFKNGDIYHCLSIKWKQDFPQEILAGINFACPVRAKILEFIDRHDQPLYQKLSRIEKFLPTIKRNIDYMMNLVQQDGLLLQFAENLKNEKKVVLAAVKQNGRALEFASSDLKNDMEVCKEAVSEIKDAIQFIGKEVDEKEDFWDYYDQIPDKDSEMRVPLRDLYFSIENKLNREIGITGIVYTSANNKYFIEIEHSPDADVESVKEYIFQFIPKEEFRNRLLFKLVKKYSVELHSTLHEQNQITNEPSSSQDEVLCCPIVEDNDDIPEEELPRTIEFHRSSKMLWRSDKGNQFGGYSLLLSRGNEIYMVTAKHVARTGGHIAAMYSKSTIERIFAEESSFKDCKYTLNSHKFGAIPCKIHYEDINADNSIDISILKLLPFKEQHVQIGETFTVNFTQLDLEQRQQLKFYGFGTPRRLFFLQYFNRHINYEKENISVYLKGLGALGKSNQPETYEGESGSCLSLKAQEVFVGLLHGEVRLEDKEDSQRVSAFYDHRFLKEKFPTFFV